MFDPGWRTQHRGWPANIPPEDQGTRDSGNDPEGMVSRCDYVVDRLCHLTGWVCWRLTMAYSSAAMHYRHAMLRPSEA
jgi:hypothetical protein